APLCANTGELRAGWIATDQRAEILHQLADRGIDFSQVALQAGKPDADPFDLHDAHGLPPARHRVPPPAITRIRQEPLLFVSTPFGSPRDRHTFSMFANQVKSLAAASKPIRRFASCSSA